MRKRGAQLKIQEALLSAENENGKSPQLPEDASDDNQSDCGSDESDMTTFSNVEDKIAHRDTIISAHVLCIKTEAADRARLLEVRDANNSRPSSPQASPTHYEDSDVTNEYGSMFIDLKDTLNGQELRTVRDAVDLGILRLQPHSYVPSAPAYEGSASTQSATHSAATRSVNQAYGSLFGLPTDVEIDLTSPEHADLI